MPENAAEMPKQATFSRSPTGRTSPEPQMKACKNQAKLGLLFANWKTINVNTTLLMHEVTFHLARLF